MEEREKLAMEDAQNQIRQAGAELAAGISAADLGLPHGCIAAARKRLRAADRALKGLVKLRVDCAE